MSSARYPVPPLHWAVERADEHQRVLAMSLRGVLDGETNNVSNVTLDASSTTTLVTDARIAAGMAPLLVPMSALAATAVGAGVVWTTVKNGEITIHHDSDPSTDRVFGVVFFG